MRMRVLESSITMTRRSRSGTGQGIVLGMKRREWDHGAERTHLVPRQEPSPAPPSKTAPWTGVLCIVSAVRPFPLRRSYRYRFDVGDDPESQPTSQVEVVLDKVLVHFAEVVVAR